MQDNIYNEITGKARPSLFAASGLLLLAVLGLWAASLLASLAPSGMDQDLLVNALYYLPFIGLPILLYALRRPGISEGMRMNPVSPFSMVMAAMLGLWCVYIASVCTGAWNALLEMLGLEPFGEAEAAGSARELTLSIITLAAIPAIFEELLFRGFVLSAWETRGTAFGIGVTAVFFALLHGNLFGWPAYLMVGVISGYLCYALNSIYASMAFHTVYNTACLVITYMASKISSDEVEASGSVVLSMVIDGILIAGLIALILRAFELRRRMNHIEPIPRIRRPLDMKDKLMLWAALAAMTVTTVLTLILGG